ncbi:MAG: hypothetical protein JWM98_1912 [Thermoleophilia bacterium]|nr:hypothetical protein [Thermoleophilia bacterium]
MSADLDTRIRAELDGDRLTSRERESLWQRVDGALDRPAARIRRRSALPTRTLFAAALIVLTLGGIALAADQGVVHRIFGEDEPVVNKLDQFRNPDVERATAAEYEALTATTMVPGVKRLGVIRDDEMVALYHLAPIDESRVVVDDPRVGRVVAVPTSDHEVMCELYRRPDAVEAIGGSGGCGANFDAQGLSVGYGTQFDRGSDKIHSIFGMASDDVDRVELGFADGSTERVTLVDNALYWSSERTPTTIQTMRGDVRSSEPVRWP